MPKLLVAVFIILHGLVHLWYVTLNQRLVEFKPEMGWTGKSWILTGLLGDGPTRLIGTALYVLATVGFVAAGSAVLFQQQWWRAALIASAALSATTLLLYWDGSAQLLVQKGLIGLIINVAFLVALLVLNWSPLAS